MTESRTYESEDLEVRAECVLTQCRREIVIVAASRDDTGRTVNELGRGGSDTTAVACGRSEGDRREIYTDVDGVTRPTRASSR